MIIIIIFATEIICNNDCYLKLVVKKDSCYLAYICVTNAEE